MKNLHKNIGIFALSLLTTATAVYIYSPVIGSHADTTATAEVDVNVGEVMALSLDTNELNLSSNPNNFVSGTIAATVSTNSQYGYTLTLEDEDASTDMIHSNENVSDVITSTFSGAKTSSEMEVNTWGFSLDSTDFSKIPVNGSPATLKRTNAPMATETETTPVDFGVKLGNVASGTYSDSVLFTMYTNGQNGPGPNGDPNAWCTYQFDGVCWSESNMTEGTYTQYSEEYGGYYTWEQANTVCANYTGLDRPAGTWRLPTSSEWAGLYNAYGTGAELANSPLAIPYGGRWAAGMGGFNLVGSWAYYWTGSNSTTTGGVPTSYHLHIMYDATSGRNYNIVVTSANDNNLYTVRCVADLEGSTADSVQLEVNGLHWMKENAATGEYGHYDATYGGYYNLEQAETFCSTYTGDNQTAGTWRLPTMEEWQIVTNRDLYNTKTELMASPLALNRGGYYVNGAFRQQGNTISYWTDTRDSGSVRYLTNSNNDAVAYMYNSATTESNIRCVRDK